MYSILRLIQSARIFYNTLTLFFISIIGSTTWAGTWTGVDVGSVGVTGTDSCRIYKIFQLQGQTPEIKAADLHSVRNDEIASIILT